MGGALVLQRKRATALLLTHRRNTSRFLSNSSLPYDHASVIKDVAKAQPPQHLAQLMGILQARGESIISPGAKQGLLPLIIPLSENNSGTLTALLRWPTAPTTAEMPVMEVRKHGVWFLAKNVDQFIHRVLVEADVTNHREICEELFHAAAHAGTKIYSRGDLAKSKISDLDMYLLRKVGLFPDVLERKVLRHVENGDHVSALVAIEFYTKRGNFPGFARPFVFNAEILLKLGRDMEARDAARGALKSSWWTLGCKYERVARIATLGDDPIEYRKGKITEEGAQRDLERGKPPFQIALDKAAILLDLASLDGSWDDSLEQIADCYEEAGLRDVAKFVLYRD